MIYILDNSCKCPHFFLHVRAMFELRVQLIYHHYNYYKTIIISTSYTPCMTMITIITTTAKRTNNQRNQCNYSQCNLILQSNFLTWVYSTRHTLTKLDCHKIYVEFLMEKMKWFFKIFFNYRRYPVLLGKNIRQNTLMKWYICIYYYICVYLLQDSRNREWWTWYKWQKEIKAKKKSDGTMKASLIDSFLLTFHIVNGDFMHRG